MIANRGGPRRSRIKSAKAANATSEARMWPKNWLAKTITIVAIPSVSAAAVP